MVYFEVALLGAVASRAGLAAGRSAVAALFAAAAAARHAAGRAAGARLRAFAARAGEAARRDAGRARLVAVRAGAYLRAGLTSRAARGDGAGHTRNARHAGHVDRSAWAVDRDAVRSDDHAAVRSDDARGGHVRRTLRVLGYDAAGGDRGRVAVVRSGRDARARYADGAALTGRGHALRVRLDLSAGAGHGDAARARAGRGSRSVVLLQFVAADERERGENDGERAHWKPPSRADEGIADGHGRQSRGADERLHGTTSRSKGWGNPRTNIRRHGWRAKSRSCPRRR